MQYSGNNPYLNGLGEEGDVSLAPVIILLLGLVGIGAGLLFFKEKNKGDYYDDYEEPEIARVRNVIADFSDSAEEDTDIEDDTEEDDFED